MGRGEEGECLEIKRIRSTATAIVTIAKAAHGDRLTVDRPFAGRRCCRSSVLLSLLKFLPPSKDAGELTHHPQTKAGGSGQPTPTDIKQALKAQ